MTNDKTTLRPIYVGWVVLTDPVCAERLQMQIDNSRFAMAQVLRTEALVLRTGP